MVDSWVPLSEGLTSVLIKTRNPYFREKIEELNAYVMSGDSFSRAMRKVPQIFDIGEISIIEAGETIWMLVQALQKLSDNLQKVHELRSQVKTALTYPIIIFFFLILAIVVVLSYVIPSLTPLFETAEVKLPWSTQALIATSDFLVNNYWYIILLLLSAIIAIIGYGSTQEWKSHINNIALQLPLIWKVYKNYILANISSNLGSLIWSGVDIIKTLSLTAKSTGSSVYEILFQSIIHKVSNGSKIVIAMEEVDEEGKYFPLDFLQMLSVWEKTAQLEEISKKINKQYTREVQYSLKNLTKWIEPLAILIAWVFVIWFAMAIFWAILKISDTVN